MRNRFVIIAKLIGLLMLNGILAAIGASMRLISGHLSTSVGTAWVPPTGLILFISLVILLLLLGMAWILIVRTEWLADKLGVVIKDDNQPSPERTAVTLPLLQVGLGFLYLFGSQRIAEMVWRRGVDLGDAGYGQWR